MPAVQTQLLPPIAPDQDGTHPLLMRASTCGSWKESLSRDSLPVIVDCVTDAVGAGLPRCHCVTAWTGVAGTWLCDARPPKEPLVMERPRSSDIALDSCDTHADPVGAAGRGTHARMARVAGSSARSWTKMTKSNRSTRQGARLRFWQRDLPLSYRPELGVVVATMCVGPGSCAGAALLMADRQVAPRPRNSTSTCEGFKWADYSCLE